LVTFVTIVAAYAKLAAEFEKVTDEILLHCSRYFFIDADKLLELLILQNRQWFQCM